MKLIKKEIPQPFLRTLPAGMKFISKNENEFLVIEKLLCPHGHNLVSDEVHIHGEASIKLQIKLNECEGILFLDAFWGSHTKLYSFIPNNHNKIEIIDIYCPICGVSLLIDEPCPAKDCTSKKMVQMHLPGKNNRILACSRFGCPEHRIEINNMNNNVTEMIDDINFFGIGLEDDLFKGV
ncbi:MAG: hypothetical protein K9M56_09620 [Victivallales bacterium]|nr:hypothetical protein [Victivallales bacterium]